MWSLNGVGSLKDFFLALVWLHHHRFLVKLYLVCSVHCTSVLTKLNLESRSQRGKLEKVVCLCLFISTFSLAFVRFLAFVSFVCQVKLGSPRVGGYSRGLHGRVSNVSNRQKTWNNLE